MKTKCRPVVIESKEPTDLFIGKTYGILHYNNPTPEERFKSYQQLILISLEDDKIEVGDTFYDRSDNQIVKWNMSYSFPSESYEYCSKVIVLQHQLSIEYIRRFIEEYNKSKINDVEIEMESVGNYRHTKYVHKYYQPKLINGFVTIVKKESILYTQQQVDELLDRNTAFVTDLMLKKQSILYTEEKVIELLKQMYKFGFNGGYEEGFGKFESLKHNCNSADNWIKENL